MRKLGVAALVLLVGVAVACGSNSITWTTSGQGAGAYAGQRIFMDSGFTTPVPGSQTAGSGGFIQLVFVGTDGYDGLDLGNTEGVMGNDDVVAWSSLGIGKKAAKVDGNFTVTATPTTYPNDSDFIIRFFDLASPNYVIGEIPQSGEYGFVAGFQNTSLVADTFAIDSDVYTDLPVPEPGTILLALTGLATILVRRKLRRE
jgi:hypothetical protein